MKLIATNFTYSMLDAIGNRKIFSGSYLGIKEASRDTIRRFLRRNGTDRFEGRLESIGASYESQWISK